MNSPYMPDNCPFHDDSPVSSEPLFVCDICGRPIFEDDSYYDFGDLYCDECVDNKRRTA